MEKPRSKLIIRDVKENMIVIILVVTNFEAKDSERNFLKKLLGKEKFLIN